MGETAFFLVVMKRPHVVVQEDSSMARAIQNRRGGHRRQEPAEKAAAVSPTLREPEPEPGFFDLAIIFAMLQVAIAGFLLSPRVEGVAQSGGV